MREVHQPCRGPRKEGQHDGNAARPPAATAIALPQSTSAVAAASPQARMQKLQAKRQWDGAIGPGAAVVLVAVGEAIVGGGRW